MMKLFDGEKVFIPAEEIRGCGMDTGLFEHEMETHPVYGDIISESNYNRIMRENDVVLPHGFTTRCEMTRVNSFCVEADSIYKLRPLKFLFLSSIGESKEQINERIEKETAKELHDAEARIAAPQRYTEKYYREKDAINKVMPLFKKHVEPLGLVLQCFTEICNGVPRTTFYFAGDGIFYEWCVDFEYLEDYIRSFSAENGSIVFYDNAEEDVQRISKSTFGRDFRQHAVLDNLVYCLTNLDIKNDFSDYVNYSDSGIHFSVPLTIIMKLINGKCCPETILLEGMPDISEKVVAPV